MKISSVQLAEFINQIPEAYYFEDTAEELWERILVSEGKRWRAVDPTVMVDPSECLGSGYFDCNDHEVDPLNLRGKGVMPVLKKWLANQSSSVLAFRIPNEKREQVLVQLRELGITPL